MTACIASIFELKLSEVPWFVKGNQGSGKWFKPFYEFCYQRGYQIVPYYVLGNHPQLDWNNLPEHLQGMYCYHLACGPAERGFGHATVGWRDTIVHDPHPSKAGLLKINEYYFLKPIKK